MNPDRPASPFLPDDVELLFNNLMRYERIVLAVSGGADSTCLMLLAAQWAERHPSDRKRLTVVTVDHALRAESASEAERVAAMAAKLGLFHTTVTNTEPPPDKPFAQAWARALRYRLLANVALAGLPVGATAAIMTAHHQDDQAETVLMRLARGSGVDGLAAMRRTTIRADGLHHLRPLLNSPKARMIATLEEASVTWSEDPSNADLRFERAQLRAAGAAMTALGLTPSHLALTAARAARAADALDHATRRALRDPHLITFHPLGFVQLSWHRLLAEPEEVRLRMLIEALGWLNPKPVSLGQLEMQTEGWTWKRFQINNCAVWRTETDDVYLTAEQGRLASVPVRSHQAIRFGPFTCQVGELTNDDMTIGHVIAGVDGPTQRLIEAKGINARGPLSLQANLPLWVVKSQPVLYALFHPANGPGRLGLSCPTLGLQAHGMTVTLPRPPSERPVK